MRYAMLAMMIVPGVVGVGVLARSPRSAVAAPSARADAFAAQVARALTGTFAAPSSRTAGVTLPPIHRSACEVSAPGLGAHVVYVEDAFEGRRGRPFSQRLLAVDAAPAGAIVREFTPIDPESLIGLCATPGASVYRANTVERRGCELTLRRDGRSVSGRTLPMRCESRINDARFVDRALRVDDRAVELRERGVDPQGRVVWGGEAVATRFVRRD